jgi:hypothetical protein
MELRGKGIVNIQGIDFWSIGTYHDNKGGKVFGENSILCFEVDGIKIGHSGDIGHVSTEEQLEEIKKYRMDIFLLCIGLIEKEGERLERFVIDTEARIMNGIWEVMEPIIRCLIPLQYRNAKCDFRFITVDEFIKGNPNVRHGYQSDMCFFRTELPPAAYIQVLPAAL